MSLKTLIIILVVLGLLFAAAVLVGASRQDDPNAKPTNSWQGNLIKSFGNLIPKGKVGADDVRRAIDPSCWRPQEQRMVIQSGLVCLYYFNPSKMPRLLRLSLTEGNSAQLLLSQPVNSDGDMVTAKPVLDQGNEPPTVDPVINGQTIRFNLYRQQKDTDTVKLVVQCNAAPGKNCSLTFKK